MDASVKPRTLVLIGGATAAGKTTTAAAIAPLLGAQWFKIDTLWRAIREALPEGSPERALLHLDNHERLRSARPEDLRDQHIAASRFICRTLPKAFAAELLFHETVVADGAWLLPEFVASLVIPEMEVRTRAVFIHEPDAVEVKNTMRRRRGLPVTASWQRGGAAAWALHGDWLAVEAERYCILVVAARPRETLTDRVMAALALALGPD